MLHKSPRIPANKQPWQERLLLGYAINKNRSYRNWLGIQSYCWEWTKSRSSQNLPFEKRYGMIGVEGKICRSHIQSFIYFRGEYPKIDADGKRILVCHHCDNAPCINPDHLFLGTHQDNSDDKYKKGREGIVSGEDTGMSKVTAEQVLQIRYLCERKEHNQETIGAMFGIDQTVVSCIKLRKTWKHI